MGNYVKYRAISIQLNFKNAVSLPIAKPSQLLDVSLFENRGIRNTFLEGTDAVAFT